MPGLILWCVCVCVCVNMYPDVRSCGWFNLRDSGGGSFAYEKNERPSYCFQDLWVGSIEAVSANGWVELTLPFFPYLESVDCLV
jgi:hypothetical protein